MSLQQCLGDILPAKAKKAACLSGADTLAKAIKAMAASHAPAVLIAQDKELEGIVTRGDTLRCLGQAPTVEEMLGRRLDQIMSAPVVIASACETIAEALHKMISNGVKHLPLWETGKTTFILHLADLLAYKADLLQTETEQLHDYIDHLHDADKD